MILLSLQCVVGICLLCVGVRLLLLSYRRGRVRWDAGWDWDGGRWWGR